jgi:hypothetical protein
VHLTGPFVQKDRRVMVAPVADAPPLTVPFGSTEFLADKITATYEREDGSPWVLVRIHAEGGRLLKTGKASALALHEGVWSDSSGEGSFFPKPDPWLLEFASQWEALFNHPQAWQG